MSEGTALQRLLVWLSPAFPVGGFAWSAGLETAIVDGRIESAASARDWIADGLAAGAARTDAVLFAHAHRGFGSPATLGELADLAIALAPARERLEETLTMGAAFLAAARAWPSEAYGNAPGRCPYPVAVGLVAAAHAIALEAGLTAFLTAQVHAQVSVAQRLVPIGQTEALGVLAGLESAVAETARAAQEYGLAEIGAVAYAADIAQMRHETLATRIFKS